MLVNKIVTNIVNIIITFIVSDNSFFKCPPWGTPRRKGDRTMTILAVGAVVGVDLRLLWAPGCHGSEHRGHRCRLLWEPWVVQNRRLACGRGGQKKNTGGAPRLTSHRLGPAPPVPTARQPFSGVTPEVHLTSSRRPRARAFESAISSVGLRLRHHL